MGKKITEQQLENIVTRVKVYGESKVSIAKELGFSESFTGAIVTTFDLVREQNWEEIVSRTKRNLVHPSHVRWAAAKLGVDAPMDRIEEAYRECLETKHKKRAAIAEQTEIEEVKAKEKHESTNENLFLVKLLEALHTQNELLEQLMDVVLPKYCGDMKDNINANTDVICERLKNCEQSLDKIAYNSRKRGL